MLPFFRPLERLRASTTSYEKICFVLYHDPARCRVHNRVRPKEGEDGRFKLGHDDASGIDHEEVDVDTGEEIDGRDHHGEKDLNYKEEYFRGVFPFDINEENLDDEDEHGDGD